MHQTFELTRTRLLHLLREPEMVFWGFVFPVLLSMVLGFAFKDGQVESVRVGVLAGATGDHFVEALRAAEAVEVVVFRDPNEAERRLRTGGVLVLVRGTEVPELQLDPTRPESDVAALRAEDALQRAAGRADAVTIGRTNLEGAGSRYVDWLIPGLLGMSLMSTGIWGIGFAIVEARQKKLLKRFLVTPMARHSFLLSFIFSRLLFLILEVGVLVVFAILVLGIPFEGNVVVFSLIALVGGLSFSGLAVLVGSRAKTAEGVGGLIYLVFLPMGLTSGIFFSYEKFSDGLIPWIQALPLTALNDALRANMLEGAGLMEVLPQMGVQLAWGIVPFVLGLRIFRWS